MSEINDERLDELIDEADHFMTAHTPREFGHDVYCALRELLALRSRYKGAVGLLRKTMAGPIALNLSVEIDAFLAKEQP